jgi:cobalt-zinc-cadmium efflux system membrane fusion protein
LVLVGLGALAYAGHQSGWTIPKFSTLIGRPPAEESDWCSEHNVPESRCVLCKPELLPQRQEYGWCPIHHIPECPYEHPDVAQLVSSPAISRAALDRAERGLSLLVRAEPNSKCKSHLKIIQFASKEAFDRTGIDVAFVSEEPVTESISANGEITYDQTRVARLAARVPGTVWRADKRAGQRVQAGEVVAVLDAMEVGRAKSELLQALAQVELRARTQERTRDAFSQGTVSDRQVREAQAGLRESQIRLLSAQQALINLGLPVRVEELQGLSPDEIVARTHFLGLPDDIAKTLDPRTTSANLVAVRAPFEGMITSREIVAGEVVDTSKTLLVLVDSRFMWLTVNVRQEDANHVGLGQPVLFKADGYPSEFRGRVSWISTSVDEKTRTVKIRAELENPDGQLRAHTFGTGRIVLRQEKNGIVVPNEAIQSDGDCQVVFVRNKQFFDDQAPKLFHVRKVRLGARNDTHTEILAGVLPGEVVATKGSAVLKAQLKKSDLGEG